MPHESTPISVLDRLRVDPDDRQAMSRLMAFCEPYFLCWAKKFLRNDHDVQDLLQELFLKMLGFVRSFDYDPGKRFRGLLFLFARNAAIEFIRQKKKDAKTGLGPLDIADEKQIPDFIDKEFQAHVVQRAMEIMRTDFEPSTWKAVEMLILEGKPATEVAKQLGTTVEAIYMAKSRVLKRLRDELGGLID